MTNEYDDDQTKSFVALAAGTKVSHYTIISKIGAGAMGEVYLADDVGLHRRVALKFLPDQLSNDESSKARFQREVQTAASLSHDNIVTIFEVSEFKSRPFFSMQYVDGQSLREVLKTRQLKFIEAIDLATQVCDGLRVAHDAGVIHRDIKPSNIMIDSSGRPKLVDFGLATVTGVDPMTKSGALLGTVGYIAPEVVLGKRADHRSDIFSVGVILYELLSGIHPYRRDTEAATLHAIVYDDPTQLAEHLGSVPDGVQRIIDRALNKDPHSRYQSVAELYLDLKSILLSSPQGDSFYLPRKRIGRPRRRTMAVAGAALVLTTLILSILLNVGPLHRWLGIDPVPDRLHVAVLPFTEIGGDEEDKLLCDGLVETLSSRLTQLELFNSALLVVPANVMQSRGVTNADEARVRFGANLVVSGSVQQLQDIVRMTLNLVDTKSNRQIRAKVIDSQSRDLTELQDTSFVVLTEMLEVELQPYMRDAVQSGNTQNRKAKGYYLRAMGYLQHPDRPENLDSAAILFQRAIAVDPHYANALAGLGETYWRMYSLTADPHLEEQAIYYTRKALDADDNVAQVHAALGLIYLRTGRSSDAAAEYNLAIDIDSAYRDAYNGLAKAMVSLGRFDSAETVYKTAIAVNPDYCETYISLGLQYQQQGMFDKAREMANLAAAIQPEGYEAWNDMGALFYRIGDSERAIEMWNRSVDISPNYFALQNLGSVHLMNHDYDEAIVRYEQALALNPSDYRVWLNLGYALEHTGSDSVQQRQAFAKGIELGERRLRINPNDAWVLADLADAYASIGADEKALTSIRQALQSDSNNIEIIVTAASVYEQIEMQNTARLLISKALEQGYPVDQLEAIPELASLMTGFRADSSLFESK